jgi:hypothetical protein
MYMLVQYVHHSNILLLMLKNLNDIFHLNKIHFYINNIRQEIDDNKEYHHVNQLIEIQIIQDENILSLHHSYLIKKTKNKKIFG